MASAAEELDRKCRQAIAILHVLRHFPDRALTTRQVGDACAYQLGLDYATVEGRSDAMSLWDNDRTRLVLRWLEETGDVICVKHSHARDLCWRHAHPLHTPCTHAEQDYGL